MPLNGRNFSQLALLLPGVITTEPNSFTEPKNFGAGRPFVNGQREQANNYMLDGVDMNEPIDNLLPYQPSPDALAEVRVETNNYSAEFGNVAGAVIGSTIKSGTNEYPRRRVRVLARQQHGRQHLGEQPRRRQEGRAVAAHFRRHDWRPDREEQAVLLRRLPVVLPRSPERAGSVGRAGIVAARRLFGRGVTIKDPLTGQPFPGNQIDPSRFSPIARAVLANQQLYPSPNRPGDTSNLVTPSL